MNQVSSIDYNKKRNNNTLIKIRRKFEVIIMSTSLSEY